MRKITIDKYKIYSILFLILIFTGCRKNETGGKAQVTGFVIYNGVRVPSTTVYIKYGATQFAGSDPTTYDSQQTTDAQGNFTFSTLFEGNYYLYALGYYVDPSTGYQTHVVGGTEVVIPHQKSSVNYDIAVKKQ